MSPDQFSIFEEGITEMEKHTDIQDKQKAMQDSQKTLQGLLSNEQQATIRDRVQKAMQDYVAEKGHPMASAAFGHPSSESNTQGGQATQLAVSESGEESGGERGASRVEVASPADGTVAVEGKEEEQDEDEEQVGRSLIVTLTNSKLSAANPMEGGGRIQQLEQ